jgi:hypothetical protein
MSVEGRSSEAVEARVDGPRQTVVPASFTHCKNYHAMINRLLALAEKEEGPFMQQNHQAEKAM